MTLTFLRCMCLQNFICFVITIQNIYIWKQWATKSKRVTEFFWKKRNVSFVYQVNLAMSSAESENGKNSYKYFPTIQRIYVQLQWAKLWPGVDLKNKKKISQCWWCGKCFRLISVRNWVSWHKKINIDSMINPQKCSWTQNLFQICHRF